MEKRRLSKFNTEIPRKLLVDEVRRIARLLVKVPTMKEFDANARIGRAVTCEKKFRGWNNFLISAGLNPELSRISISEDDLKNEFLRIAKSLRRAPTTTEFDSLKILGSSSTVAKRLGRGKWTSVCKSLAYSPPPRSKPPAIGGWNKGVRTVKLNPDELRHLYEEEGLSVSSIARKLGAGIGTIRRRMIEAGIEVRKHNYMQPVQTLPETLLYAELEEQRIPFMKQQPIDGLYVVDALVPGAKIVIEADGDYWHRSTDPDIVKRDQKKTKYLQARGYIVYRFSESEIKSNVKACIDQISNVWRNYKH
jgi:very-short-patch-repair endonuclease